MNEITLVGVLGCSLVLLSCSSGLSPRERPVPFREPLSITALPDFGTTARVEMRLARNLRELDPTESGLRLFEIPPGTFSFVRLRDISYRYDKDIRLRRKHVQHEDFELHKLADGSVTLVGFVTHEVAVQLEDWAANKRLQVTLYSDPWPLAPTGVAIPFSDALFIRAKKHLELDTGRGPAALDIELSL